MIWKWTLAAELDLWQTWDKFTFFCALKECLVEVVAMYVNLSERVSLDNCEIILQHIFLESELWLYVTDFESDHDSAQC